MDTFNKKEIIALTDEEHVLYRPTMYIGSIEPIEEKIPIIRNGKIVNVLKKISPGFYKLVNEILDNAFDEAKRLKGKMKKIEVHFNSKTNEVIIKDTGEGFYKGTEINEKTGKNNIETAMTQLRAGTNFFNEDSADTLIGTNGVGASLVNMLSKKFTIETCNREMYFKKTWYEFRDGETIIRKKKKTDELGTTISFIPREYAEIKGKKIKLFKNYKWDEEYILTLMNFRNFLKKYDDKIKNLEFEVFFDNKKLNLDIDFIPKNNIFIKNRLGVFILWESFEDSVSVSFINGAQCSGSHQRIFQNWINNLFEYDFANHFYETMIILNFPPKYVKFADQNKTKYAGNRWEIEKLIKKHFYKKLIKNIKTSKIFKQIKQKIDEKLFNENIKQIERKKRNIKKKISDKYFKPSQIHDTLFIVEGNSARGSILQKRNPKTDGVYTLKGKIKNVRKITDLSNNDEIIDLMAILGLKPKEKTKPIYEKIVIATDWDPDGIGHIASLLINLFYRWFPHIIKEGRLYILIIPLVSIGSGKNKQYFYSLNEYNEFKSKNNVSNERYLKGLGSLSLDDWEYVMKHRKMFRVYADKSAKKFIEIAFGNSSFERKKWLENKTN